MASESSMADESGMSYTQTKSEHMTRVQTNAILASSVLSNSLGADSPDNPQNFPMWKKVLTSIRTWLFAMTVGVGLTCFSAGKNPFVAEFDIDPALPEKFIGAFSIYLFGIAFAPYYSPHVVERVGRTIPLNVVIVLNALFNLGAGRSHGLAGVYVCRFFAGFFGGVTLVSLEGSFAELWSAERTNSYYAVQGTAGFIGGGLGAVIGGYLVHDTHGWRWTCYFPACLCAFCLLIGVTIPETYNREIQRRLAKKNGQTRQQAIAAQTPRESGTTMKMMFHITVVHPVVMFFTEPVVTLTSLIMFFTWGVLFQWFISVPAALEPAPPAGPGFSVQRTGLAFLTAIVGAIMAALTVILIENVMLAVTKEKDKKQDEEWVFASVEYRVIPAMFGMALMTAALFWIGNTIAPGVKPVVPIIGTAFFVWGAGCVTYSIVPYTFDLFQPAPTLSAITSQAVGRILAAGFLPTVILFDLGALTPKWGLGVLGFISLAFWPIPFVLFFCGTKWRRNSKYNMMDLEE